MFGLFQQKRTFSPLTVDLHSHLIPGIDDGVKTWEESLEIIRGLSALGIKKLITTPHILSDYYPNTPTIIREGVATLRQKITEENLDMEVQAGAEYYVDDSFVEQLDTNQELLTFAGNHILLETAFMNKPMQLEDVFFKLKAKGLQPIFAHPERYSYIQQDPALILKFRDMGVLQQVNASSFTGHYSYEAKQTAQYLIAQQWVDFVGSDIHNLRHLEVYKKALQTKSFQKAGQLSLRNNSL
ncbi:hypothetical protein BFP72_18330 [Reichenbachiella sp. 5M10]|uniref:tyrosine-protein phosphatase n=1 Tax=Reichenbachiella sp. 5M10 TaxID=1889772 RepID=UPI000C145944|nr:CpsB/CapC family capsule biosynthesis tyrosine phosphatase [Reichenbachiella sp. 5M10]PIB37224.1 hypothetical protein BFP72_18330 [Reichenbachiella sp. 5M10]